MKGFKLSPLKAAAQKTVVANVSQGFSETLNYEALLQVVSYKFGAEVQNPMMMSVFDHEMNRSFLCMQNKKILSCIWRW